jgi:hypothetical protein
MKLYENQECDFYILNVYTKNAYGLDLDTVMDPYGTFDKLSETLSMQGLGDIIIRLTFEHDCPNHRFHMISSPKGFIEAIKDVVANVQIDMIIMGDNGTSNEGQGEYGKNTLAIIENVRKCPVLVVPENVTFDRPEDIVLATNFKIDFKTPEVKYLAEIAKMTDASIHVLCLVDNGALNPQQKRNKIRLRKYFKEVDHSFNVLRKVKMADALSCFVGTRNGNMISYIDKAPSLWVKWGLGRPTLGKLRYFKDVPVLALHG